MSLAYKAPINFVADDIFKNNLISQQEKLVLVCNKGIFYHLVSDSVAHIIVNAKGQWMSQKGDNI